MISVTSRDARKGLGLVDRRREMEENELEEGEACSYDNNDEFDASIDPDIALSYIGEKLENVLGHLQKDFEGGVSADKLGAKYGGYGSFLPTYAQSPAQPHSEAREKLQNHRASRSPNNSKSQGVQGFNTDLFTKPHADPVPNAGETNHVSKQKPLFASRNGVDAVSGPKFANKNPSNLLEQKPLKFRIKMGPDNLLGRKNAAIYNGLGLGVSPSSSLDSSPSENGTLYHEHLGVSSESPTKILKVMTSPPLHGDSLLSPLSDNLLHFSQETAMKDNSFSHMNFGPQSPRLLVNGSDPLQVDEKVLGNKKEILIKKVNCSIKSIGRNKMTAWDDTIDSSSKDVRTDTLASEGLNPKTSKLPLSSGRCPIASVTKTTGSEVSDAEEKPVDPIFNRDTLLEADTPVNLDGKVREDGKHNSSDGHFFKFSNSSNAEPKVSSRVKKDLKVDPVNSCKRKRDQKDAGSTEGSTRILLGKKKLNGSQNSSMNASQLLGDKGDSSALAKSKPSDVINHGTKDELEGLKSQKDRTGDKYKEFFGEMFESEEEDQMGSFGTKYSDKVKKPTASANSAPKERLGNKKFKKHSTSGKHPGLVPDSIPLPTERPDTEAAPATTAPVLIEDHWVCCDKCQKWRLLPNGMDPDTLPDKWLCSMLYWLPGMNRCSVSQDETTKALMATYQLPAAETQVVLQNSVGSDVSLTNKSQIGFPGQDLQSYSLKVAPSVGKRKKVSKELSDATYKEGLTPPIHTSRKAMQAGKTSVTHTERHKKGQKEKLKSMSQHADGGVVKTLKMNSQSKVHKDRSELPSLMETESLHLPDEGWASDNGKDTRKQGLSPASRMPVTLARNDRARYVDAKCLPKKASVKITKSSSQNFQENEINNRDIPRKRKLKESHDTKVLEDGTFMNGDLNESDKRKDKKARILNSDGKVVTGGKGNAKSVRKGGQIRTLQPGRVHSNLQQKSLDGGDSSKKGFGVFQPSVAALSSSSKISGSHKTKTSFHDVKGSPVESVSSSPLRTSDADKLTSRRRSFSGKDEHVTNFFASDCEDYGVSDRHGALKEKTSSVAQWASHLSSEFEFQGKLNDNHLSINGSQPRLLVKEKSSLFKEKNQGQVNHALKPRINDAKIKVHEKTVAVTSNDGAKYSDVRESTEKMFLDSCKMVLGRNGNPEVAPERNNEAELVSEAGKLHNSENVPMSSKINGTCAVEGDTILRDDARKTSKQIRSDSQNENQLMDSRHLITNGHGLRELDDSSPLKKESSSQAAAKALKEATDLKHLADRRKNAGSNHESIDLYFRAALKFLYGASLLESCGAEAARLGEMAQSMQIYSSTAKLCEFCAHEYERTKHMASAALAYKCVEVAYMRVVYFSHGSANRHRQELQTALPMVPPGESPSSSASDVDNLNHPATAADRLALSRGAPSPQVTGNNVISAQNRPSLVRLLKFTQDVNFAMDASRKAQIAFAAAAGKSGEFQDGEGIISIKRALDFNFHDVDGFLHLVRLAMEAIKN